MTRHWNLEDALNAFAESQKKYEAAQSAWRALDALDYKSPEYVAFVDASDEREDAFRQAVHHVLGVTAR